MEREALIPANDLCTYYEVSYTFISGLHEAGLIELDIIDELSYVHREQLTELERLIRLHKDLEINTGGIETVAHLLERIKLLEQRLHALEQKLSLYE